MYKKMRVAVYCRVSTRLDSQDGSFDTQICHFTRYVKAHENMVLVGVYGDYGKSGRYIEGRTELQRLMADCEAGGIDLILTKSISRFARNMVDCVSTIRVLRELGVAVRFEREGFETDGMYSELMLSVLAAFAQDESRSISENVKWSYRQRCQRGEHNLGSNRVLGYDCIDGKLVPNRDSPVVLEIFTRYSQAETPWQIAKHLNAQGLTGLRGRPFESRYLTDDHEPIIPRPLWQAVQDRITK